MIKRKERDWPCLSYAVPKIHWASYSHCLYGYFYLGMGSPTFTYYIKGLFKAFSVLEKAYLFYFQFCSKLDIFSLFNVRTAV